MTDCNNSSSPSSGNGASPACGGTTPCPTQTKIEITDLTLNIDNVTAANKIIMNDPNYKVLVTALVTHRESTASAAVDNLPPTVKFTFTDPGTNNARKVDSFNYAGSNFLGKKADPTAIYWETHSDHATTSSDGFKLQAEAELKVLSATTAEAKIWFKPSAVGGDNFKIKGTVYRPDGTTEIADDESAELTVWRKITLIPWEIPGQTHVSTHGTTAKMATYYTASTFVEYELGSISAVPASSTATYIGLWDHSSLSELNWATHSTKLPAETPTAPSPAQLVAASGPAGPAKTAALAAIQATETGAANGPAGPARAAAQAAIQTKANNWRDRLISVYMSGLNNWASDAGIPIDTIVAIEFDHPKYSLASPDSTTTQWLAFPWLRITVEGRSIHPDQRWITGQGFSWGHRAYITAGMSAARTEVAIAHEAAHETKNQFERAQFGAGDHSPVAGLMDPAGTLSAFTNREKELLRGLR